MYTIILLCYVLHRTMIWSILALLPLFCGTWIIGLLLLAANEVNDEVFKALSWVFTITNSLQVHYLFICMLLCMYVVSCM